MSTPGKSSPGKSTPGKVWFRRKLFGWGWTPASLEGWFSLGAWLLVALACHAVRDARPFLSFLGIAAATGALVVLALCKGKPPAWQWGRKKR